MECCRSFSDTLSYMVGLLATLTGLEMLNFERGRGPALAPLSNNIFTIYSKVGSLQEYIQSRIVRP